MSEDFKMIHICDFVGVEKSYMPNYITSDQRKALLERWTTLNKDALYFRLLESGFKMQYFDALYATVYDNIAEVVPDSENTFEAFSEYLGDAVVTALQLFFSEISFRNAGVVRDLREYVFGGLDVTSLKGGE